MGKITTVVFDLDGTILDTLDDLANSVNYALRAFGFPERTREQVRRTVGHGVRDLIGRSVPEGTDPDTMQKCLEMFRTHYREHMQDETRPYEDVLPVLRELVNRGVRLACLSNKFDAAVKELCFRFFSDYICMAVGESEKLAKKPAPDGLLHIMEELGATRDDTVYVGDSAGDVKTSHNAGVPCVAVTWGFRDRPSLEAAGADWIIDRAQDLLTLKDKSGQSLF
ncbi:MAG: HAD family hydrolase [Christensenellales bacterium]|jgi:phosphoglycolate phosphatase